MTALMRSFKVFVPAVMLFVLASCGHIGIKPEASKALTPEEAYSLGAIYEAKGETELALREYGSAAERGYADAYFAMANIHIASTEYAKAEAELLSAIKTGPSKAAYYNNLGWVYMETGRLAEAEAAVGKALNESDGSGETPAYLDTLGRIQMKGKRYAEAEKSLERAACLAEKTGAVEGLYEIYSHLAELYAVTGEPERAAAVESKMRAIKSQSP